MKIKERVDLKKKVGFRRITVSKALIYGYLIAIFIGTILLATPYAAVGPGGIGIIDALFTATSAVCVTGLIVRNTGVDFTLFGQVVIMGLIQFGGLGIMTMSTLFALLLGREIGITSRLFIREDLNYLTMAGLVRLVRHVIQVAFLLQGLGVVILFIHWFDLLGPLKALYFAIFHSISAFCNAGFDLFGNSFEWALSDPIVNFTITTLFIIGGLGFGVLFELRRTRKFSKLSIHTKVVLKVTLVLMIVGTAFIFFLESNNPDTIGQMGLSDRVMASYFTAVTPRTAGFNTIPTNLLHRASLFFIMILMFIGASPGSTGGGIKTTTITVLIVGVISYVSGKKDVELWNRRLPKDLIFQALVVVTVSMFLIMFFVTLFLITEEFSLLSIMFEIVSAFGTVGLSTGITSDLSTIGKLGIIITMFTGRVGPLTIGLALAIRSRGKNGARYPEEKISIG